MAVDAEVMVIVVPPEKVKQPGMVEEYSARLEEEGFLILDKRKLELSPKQARQLLAGGGSDQQPADVVYQYDVGPAVALAVKARDAFATFKAIEHDLDYCYGSANAYTALRDLTALFPEKPLLERTLVVVKPGFTDEQLHHVIDVIQHHDFVILCQSKQRLEEGHVRALLSEEKDDIAHLTSGDSVVMVLESLGAVKRWQLLMGPDDPDVARSVAPGSLRAMLGKNAVENGIWGSPSLQHAEKAISGFFGSDGPFPVSRTLCLVKPSAVKQGSLHLVRDAIQLYGFTVVVEDTLYISSQRAQEFCARLRDDGYFSHDADEQLAALAKDLSSGPAVAMVLAKPAAVESLAAAAGPPDVAGALARKPHSITASLGIDNALFYSRTSVGASDDIHFFFPDLPPASLPSRDQVTQFLTSVNEDVNSFQDVLVRGLTHLCKTKPVGLDALSALAKWLRENNPNKPRVQEPVDDEDSLPAIEQLKAMHDGKEVYIAFALGLPGSGALAVCRAVANQLGYEHITLDDVLKAVAAHPEHGPLLEKATSSKRNPPASLILPHLAQAMLASGKNRFLVQGFPQGLDHALSFDAQISPVRAVLFFDVPDNVAVKRLAQERKQDEFVTAQVLREAMDSAMPILEHYKLFHKVHTFDCSQDFPVVCKQVSKVLSFKPKPVRPPRKPFKPKPIKKVVKDAEEDE